MKLLLKNARILTEPFSPITEGEVHIENGKITYVGEPAPFAADVTRDIGKNLVMSGFANTHAHSAMTLFRGVADDIPLQTWLFDRIFPLEANFTKEDIYWGTQLAVAEYVRSGITAVADMYYFDDTKAKAFAPSGIALALCSGKDDLGGGTNEALEYMESAFLKYRGKNRLKYILGVHAEYTCSDELLKGTADLAINYGAPTYIHCSETLKEVGDCTVRRGMTPPEYLYNIGYFENGGIIAHGTHLDKDDITMLAEKGVYCACNPASNLKLASGVAPVYSMLQNGLQVTLGTDGAASNNALSMFREMYLLSCLQKERMKDASALSAETALAAATVKGYTALGFNGGKVAKGMDADLTVINLCAPNMQPLSDIKKSLVYAADTSNVLMTVAAGKIVYENGNYDIGENIADIYANASKCLARLLKKAGMV